MANPIDDYSFPFNFKQDPIVSNTQAILGSEIRESLDIPLQIVTHVFNSCKNSFLNMR